jgi:hypothetical protein
MSKSKQPQSAKGKPLTERSSEELQKMRILVGNGEYFQKYILPDMLKKRPGLLNDLVEEAMSDPEAKTDTLRHIGVLIEKGRV